MKDLLGFWSLFLAPRRILRAAVIIRPSTLLKFHEALEKRKYRLLFSSRRMGKPRTKGPSQELIRVILQLKRRKHRFGCRQIALIIRRTFGVEIDKDVVRRVLAKHYRPEPGADGPSWLTFIGHMKDGLWSVDLFRCESITLKTHWVLVVMDPVHSPHHWVRHSDWCSRWDCAMQNVQPRHCQTGRPSSPEFR